MKKILAVLAAALMLAGFGVAPATAAQPAPDCQTVGNPCHLPPCADGAQPPTCFDVSTATCAPDWPTLYKLARAQQFVKIMRAQAEQNRATIAHLRDVARVRGERIQQQRERIRELKAALKRERAKH